MSWFNTSGITTLAKSALNTAQKTIDKALDIHEDPSGRTTTVAQEKQKSTSSFNQDGDESFFTAFGLSVDESQSVSKHKKPPNQPQDSDALSKLINNDKNSQSIWGSFTGSFFESGASDLPKNENSDDHGSVDRRTQKLVAIASQPQKGQLVRSRHQTSSVGDTEKKEDKEGSYPNERVRSRSESLSCTDDLEMSVHNQIQRQPKIESTLGGRPSRIVKKKTDLIDSKIKDSLSVKIKNDNPVSCGVERDCDVGHLVKDNELENFVDADASIDSERRMPVEDQSLVSKSQDFLIDFSETSKKSHVVVSSDTENADKTFSDESGQMSDNLKLGSASFCSVSSSSTTGESSSTLDESVGSTLSAISSKEGRSSDTITPDLFIDPTEHSLPVGMSSSWDVTSITQNVDNQNVTHSDIHTEVDNTGRIISSDEICQQDVSPTILHVEKSPETTGFVCYMLEAAMAEEPIVPPKSSTIRALSPQSTISSASSTAERSDPTKTVESEQNSGHTSGDEIETTTSSDIEIISSPSAGGESGCERTGSLSPVKQNSQWRKKVQSHADSIDGSSRRVARSIRSESPASDTSSTRDSIPAQFNFPSFFRPDISFTQMTSSGSKQQHQRNKSENSSDESEGSQAKLEALIKKLSEVNTILEAREAKVLELSHDNLDLRERSNNLKAQLLKAEEVRVADNRDVSTLTKEFTERLSNTEKRLQQALKEKDLLKCELQQATEEVSTRVSFSQVEEIKKEKDTQIAELMQEGEKLSKQLLGYSNNVKKLRSKEKDNESHIKQQREKLEEQSRELDRLRKALGAKEELEKNQIELIRQLSNSVQKYEKDLTIVKSDLEDAQEKQSSMKVALETAYKELAELHRKNVERDNQAQEAALSAEMVAKEELKACLERVQLESRLQQENLMMQIEDLRLTVMRNEKQANRREDSLRQDNANLQERLQEAEGRNEELNQNVSEATRPLLRQIDNLQSTLNLQTTTWERVERNLTDRLHEAQNQLAYAIEKELSATERYAEISSKLASLEAQSCLLRQERAILQAQLTNLKEELYVAQETKTKDSVSSEAIKQSFSDEMSRIKREMIGLEHQLDIEKTALEAEKRKNQALTEQLKEKLVSLEGSRQSSPSPHVSLSMRGSFSDNLPSSWAHDNAFDGGSGLSGMTNTRMNVYESLRAGSAATFVDSLQSQLKLRDGDIFQLQANINQLERVKESMTQEMVKLQTHNEELEASIVRFQDQESQCQDMQQKYNALLQMYGEISEEAAELRLDLQDVKDMYKAQIDELMKRSQ